MRGPVFDDSHRKPFAKIRDSSVEVADRVFDDVVMADKRTAAALDSDETTHGIAVEHESASLDQSMSSSFDIITSYRNQLPDGILIANRKLDSPGGSERIAPTTPRGRHTTRNSFRQPARSLRAMPFRQRPAVLLVQDLGVGNGSNRRKPLQVPLHFGMRDRNVRIFSNQRQIAPRELV